MKLLLLWLVAAWVVAVTADRPCAEYCVYLASGIYDIELQSGCDCIYEHTKLQKEIDARIFYEPAGLLPDYSYNKKVYISNPITSRRRAYTIYNGGSTPKTVQTYLNPQLYYPYLDLKKHSFFTKRRIGKNIPSINQKAPLYLDVDVESEDIERSVSTNTFTFQDLKLTEQSLLECGKLYVILQSRKCRETNEKDISTPTLNDEYSAISNKELEKRIQNKCSHLSHIVEKSLTEIRKSRSKLTSVTFKMDDNNQQTDESLNFKDSKNKNEHTLCKSNTESHSQLLPDNSKRTFKEDKVDYELATAKYTDTPEIISSIQNTPGVFSTIAVTSVPDVYSSTIFFTRTEESIERVGTISTDAENEYPLQIDTITTTFNIASETTTATTSTALDDNKDTGEQNTEENAGKEFKISEVERSSNNRARYEEGELPLTKIITHEFSNNTVQSFINGTEDIPNGDFSDELKPTDVVKETENSTKFTQGNQFTRSAPYDMNTTPYTRSPKALHSNITGNLYFLFNNHHIPTRFVQNTNGSLHIGIDGVSLCKTMTENNQHKSVLLASLCNCYAYNNCTHKDNY